MNKREENITTNPAQALAQFVTQFDLADVPAEVIKRAKFCLLDAFGIGLASVNYEFAKKTAAGIHSIAGDGTFPVIGEHAVRHGGGLGRRGSALYGVNTLGAGFGVLVATFDQFLEVAACIPQVVEPQLQLRHVEQGLVAVRVELQPALRGQQGLVVETEAVPDAGRLPGDVHAVADLGRLAVLPRGLQELAGLQGQFRLQQVRRGLAASILVIGEGNRAK
jgi:hypothetical protein